MKWVSLIACLFLFGCAMTTSGVVPSGYKVFKISRQASTNSPYAKTLKADALKEANRYCFGRGKTLKVIHSSETRPWYLLGQFRQVHVKFTCVDKAAH